MEYEIDKQYIFPVKEKKVVNGSLFYVINANGYECEVKAFESQRGTNPTNITCLFKGYKNEKEPVFRQDFAVLISQIYKVGEVYEFKVKNDINAFGYYEVTDKNGFIFRLVDYGKMVAIFQRLEILYFLTGQINMTVLQTMLEL